MGERKRKARAGKSESHLPQNVPWWSVGHDCLALARSLAMMFAALLVVQLCQARALLAAEEGPDQPIQPVRGLLKAKAESDLSVQIAARVAKINKREGEAFRYKDVLLEFDCDLLEADWQAANAAYKAKKLKARSKKRLLAYQAAGRLDAAVAMAEAEQAAAVARQARLKVQQCKVRAPYDGWVVARHVDVHETPQAGGKLITVVRRGPLEVEIIVPTAWLKWLREGQPFVFEVDGLGERLRGRITRIGAVVDQVSQTIRVYGEVGTPPPVVRPGMTGKVRFPRADGAGKPSDGAARSIRDMKADGGGA